MNLIARPELVHDIVGGEPYDYYPLGEFVVIAPGVCGGRPTFKNTRLEVSVVLGLLSEGYTVEEVATEYEHSNLQVAAIQEGLRLADEAIHHVAQALLPLAA